MKYTQITIQVKEQNEQTRLIEAVDKSVRAYTDTRGFPGLAVHREYKHKRMWTITHIHTGAAVGRMRNTRHEAVKDAMWIAALTDWDKVRSAGDVTDEVKQAVRRRILG